MHCTDVRQTKTQRPLILLVSLFLTAILACVDIPFAHSSNLESREADKNVFQSADTADLPGSTLRFWQGCPSSQSLPPSLVLCKHPSRRIDDSAFRTLRSFLRSTVDDAQSLCQIDEAVVRSQYECSFVEESGDTDIIDQLTLAEFMRLLAHQWQRHGKLERANQLFGRAYTIQVSTGTGLLSQIAVLQGWANLKVIVEEPERAKELAARQTTIAKQLYESGESWVSQLVDSLRFEATLLERLGAEVEAQVARLRAEALEALPSSCEGLCDEVIIERND